MHFDINNRPVGLEGELGEPGQLAEVLLQFPEELLVTLGLALGNERVEVAEPRHGTSLGK